MVSFMKFWQELKKLDSHCLGLGCRLSNIRILKEVKYGFSSKFELICINCNGKFYLSTSEECENGVCDINQVVVFANISIGCGYTQLKEFFASISIPVISQTYYSRIEKDIGAEQNKVGEKIMREAVEEEKRMAIKHNEVDSDGVPLLTVVVDGCWSHRSYGSKYSSLSGAAAIVGFYTQKVFYFTMIFILYE